MRGARTDIAAEDLPQDGGELPGVRSGSVERDGMRCTRVEVLDERGAESLCKPLGKYITVDVETFFRRRENAFAKAVTLLSSYIEELLPLDGDESVLVAGLGNPGITPDAVGPETAALTLATLHLTQRMP